MLQQMESTYGRNNNAWVPVDGITVKGTVPTVADLASVPNPVNGDLYVVSEDGHGYVYESGTWADIGPIQGPPGPEGPSGAAATVSVGSTTTGAPGTDAEVVNSGSRYLMQFLTSQFPKVLLVQLVLKVRPGC